MLVIQLSSKVEREPLLEFEEGKERNTALGVWAAVAAGGSAVGVLLGGVLTQYLSWRWNFFINVPVGIIVVLAAAKLLPHHIGEENKKVTTLRLKSRSFWLAHA